MLCGAVVSAHPFSLSLVPAKRSFYGRARLSDFWNRLLTKLGRSYSDVAKPHLGVAATLKVRQ